MSNWMYDEYKHCGVDYSDPVHAENYDGQHQKFRNYEQEFNAMLEFLSIRDAHELTLIDLGCGTGAMSVYAAQRFKKVFGVDVSDAMIRQAKKKVSGRQMDGIEFVNAGFLSYEHEDAPVDLLITKHAFHHLPDFWKQIALLKMNKMIRTGGILYLCDVVFHFNATEYERKIGKWLMDFEQQVGKEFAVEAATHIRDEHSTFKWILDGMIERAGFKIRQCRSPDGFVTEYHCVKVDEIPLP
jgi:putative AdoMet-dependent methyltransferase